MFLEGQDKDKGIVHGGRPDPGTRQDPSDVLPGLSPDAAPAAPPQQAGPSNGARAPAGASQHVPLPPRRPVAFGGTPAPRVDPVGDLARAPAPDAPTAAPQPAPLPPRPLTGGGAAPATGPAGEAARALVPDAGAIQQATQALAAYKAELAGIKSELAGQAGLDLPGLGSGLQARKAELESLISSTEARLQALGTTPIAPKIDASGLEAVKPAADSAKTALEGLNVTARPTVDTSSIAAASGAVDALLAKLRAVGAEAASAGAAAARAGASVSTLRGRSSSPSFSDGVTPGRGAE